jgi:hypothetical protein
VAAESLMWSGLPNRSPPRQQRHRSLTRDGEGGR